jgi:hypothetical protein
MANQTPRWFRRQKESSAASAAKNPRRQEYDGLQKFQHAAHGDPNDAKWKQKQPHQWIQYERQQGQGPAHHQQDAPQEEGQHGVLYESGRGEVPWLVRHSTL